jgi:hypothetical protein
MATLRMEIRGERRIGAKYAIYGWTLAWSFNLNADVEGVFIWNQDRRTTEGGVRELIGGNSPTAPIYLKEEPNQTGGMAQIEDAVLTGGVITNGEKHSNFENGHLKERQDRIRSCLSL